MSAHDDRKPPLIQPVDLRHLMDSRTKALRDKDDPRCYCGLLFGHNEQPTQTTMSVSDSAAQRRFYEVSEPW